MRRGQQRSWQCCISSPGSCLPSLFALCLFLELYLSCIYSEMHVQHLKRLVSNSNAELECGASFRSEVGGQGTACPGQATCSHSPELLSHSREDLWPPSGPGPQVCQEASWLLYWAVSECFSFQFTFVSDANTLCQIPSRSNPCYYRFHCWEAFLTLQILFFLISKYNYK